MCIDNTIFFCEETLAKELPSLPPMVLLPDVTCIQIHRNRTTRQRQGDMEEKEVCESEIVYYR
jgi:hypothetical protein